MQITLDWFALHAIKVILTDTKQEEKNINLHSTDL